MASSKLIFTVPCDPFQSRIYDVSRDEFRDVVVSGYEVHLFEREPPKFLTYMQLDATKWLVATPKWTTPKCPVNEASKL